MKGITNVVMQIVLFVKQQSQIQDTGVTSNRIRAMRMIILLRQRRVQISMLGGKIISVYEILVLIVTKHIEIFLTLTSSQVLILTQLYGIMNINLGFMVATKKVGSIDINLAGVKQ
jgi:hypothetical protein